MHVISVNTGLARPVEIAGRTVLTAIYKSPVTGRVRVSGLNIEGDQQADLTVHGGAHKAVYLYPGEHYEYWKQELPNVDFASGMFGENLTTAGLDEQSVHIGDQFRIGSALLEVTQPRRPCYKLGIRFGRADMVRRFAKSGRSGFYLSVVEEGRIGAGDRIEPVKLHPGGVTVAGVLRY